MSDYLWDKTGEPDKDVEQLEHCSARSSINRARWNFRRPCCPRARACSFHARVWRWQPRSC
jgi:hypothetical protein